MAIGNVTYEQSIGLMTAMTEITRNGAKASRGLVSIQSRYNQILDSSSSTGKKLIAFYDKHGIAIKDSEGKLRSFYDVAKDLSTKWGDLSEDEQKYFLNIQAGANQSQNLGALMSNFGTAIKATRTALDAEGSAARENARYMESMEGHLKNLSSAWEDFSRKMVNSETLKTAMDGLTKFLNLLTTDFGQTIVKAAAGLTMFGAGMKLFGGIGSLMVAPMSKANKLFGRFNKNLDKTTKVSGKVNKRLTGVGKGFNVVNKGALKGATSAGKAATKFGSLASVFAGGGVGWGILGAAGVAYGIYKLNDYLTQKYDPQNQYVKVKKDLNNLHKKQKEVVSEREKLEKKVEEGTATTSEERRLHLLERQERSLERQIELQEQLERTAWAKKEQGADKGIEKTDAYKQAKQDYLKTPGANIALADKVAKQSIGATDKLASRTLSYRDALGKLSKATKIQSDLQDKYNKAVDEGDDSKAAEYAKKLEKADNDVAKAQKDVGDTFDKLREKRDEWAKRFGSEDRMPEQFKESYKEANNLLNAFDDLQSTASFDNLKGEGLKKVINDFKTLGDTMGITVDESGKINNIDLGTFTSQMEQAGFTAGETRDALSLLANENPEATVTIDGVDVALKDIESVDDLMDVMNGKKSIGELEVDGGEEASDNVSIADKALDQINGTKATATLSAKGGEEVAEQARTSWESVDKLNGTNANATISLTGGEEVADQASTAQNSIATIPSFKQILLGANTGGAQKKVQSFKSLQDSIKENKIAKITAQQQGKGTWSGLKSLWDSIKSKVVTITANKSGNGFASGTRHAPGGLAEVNEAGWEFIRDAKTGQLRIAGGGKRTVTVLGKGDAVYTHGESLSMISNENDFHIPQHKKGKKKKQTVYDKKYQEIQDWYNNQVKAAEHDKKMNHRSDKWLADQKKAIRDQAQNKLNALNSQKIKGKGKLKRKGDLGSDIEYEVSEALEDVKHDSAVSAIEGLISGSVGTAQDLKNALAKINAEAAHLSAEEKKKYEQEAYKAHVEYNMKEFEHDKVKYADMRKQLTDYYNQGKITAKEYYDYLDDLVEKQLDKEKKALEKRQELNDNTYSLAKAYVDGQIKRLEKENEEQETQNELVEKQSELEKARTQRVKVYRQGVGFVYEQNTEAVREATKALEEYKKSEESPELKAWKEVQDLFDDLEDLADIKDLENKIGKTKEELFGGFGTNIADWTTWIKNNLATGLGYENLLDVIGDLETREAMENFLQGANDTISESQINSAIDRNRFASGTLSAPAGFARVAENGYEIALLGKGDAVMPHNVSENLMQWGRYNPVEVMQGGVGGTVENFHFDNLVLPNVTDANGFMRELQNLPNRALQYSRSRG